ncbi:MAG TPA: GNAT family N-acetyltransferase [Ignavibacteria bacterium]|nr:GNAT family N-acetyltransferase [Ignavibacteria bacterium]HMQ98327.1 GNAT family N-acetyltransferase [Ignavibacteria bacterium]
MINYNYDIAGLSKADLEPFFEDWQKKPEPAKRLEILRNSDHVIIAMDGTRIAGFINAVTDNTLSAYIPLLEVIPEYRNMGIGTELVKKMLEQLKDYYMIDLCCDEHLEGFYKKLGMVKVTGMIKRNYEKI